MVAFVALVGGGFYYWWNRPVENQSIAQVREIGAEVESYNERVQEHEKQTVNRVVIIRENVAAEIYALSADGLASAALDEIGIWCGYAGRSSDTGTAGVDGRE